jgi:hypothetical protein
LQGSQLFVRVIERPAADLRGAFDVALQISNDNQPLLPQKPERSRAGLSGVDQTMDRSRLKLASGSNRQCWFQVYQVNFWTKWMSMSCMVPTSVLSIWG